MPMLRGRPRYLFFLGGFLLPSITVQAWVTCYHTRHNNVLNPGQTLATTSSMVLMATDEKNNPKNSEEKDNSDNDGSQDADESRRIRLIEAQAKIDQILNNPIDPPFDFENVMKKVKTITPPLVIEGSAEMQLEEQVSKVEEELYKAVKAKDYETAAKKSDEISQMHVDDCGLVLQANTAFYRSFGNKDVEEMGRLWLKDRSCICIHPSFKPLSGVRDIMATWERMFESSVGSFQRTWMEPSDIQLTVKASTAVVTCTENVYARRFVRGKKRKTQIVNKLTATNIFRKVGGRWYMTYHHSSWHPNSEAARKALEPQSKSSKSNSSSSKKIISSDPFGGNILDLRGSGKDNDDEEEDESDDPTELESILGVRDFGPLIGDGVKKQQGDSDGPKIISTSLDFLKDMGGLDGLLGGIGDSDGMALPPGAIIQVKKINNNSDDEDELDDLDETDMLFNDDDDGNDDDNDDDGDNEGKNDKSILELLASKQIEKKKKKLGKNSLRSKCIETLRKFADDGRISQKQKRVLLTDVISSSARKERSLVEHAYKILCVDPADEAAAEEDFVDQCQVFAESLFEMR